MKKQTEVATPACLFANATWNRVGRLIGFPMHLSGREDTAKSAFSNRFPRKEWCMNDENRSQTGPPRVSLGVLLLPSS